MAMLRGGTKSAVSPQIIREANVLKPQFRAQFIKDRKSGLTLEQTAKKLAKRAIKRGRLERKKRVTETIKKVQKSLIDKGFTPKEIKKVFKTFPIK